jgi:hypothetical protein
MSVKPNKENRQQILIEDPIYTEYDLSNLDDEEFNRFVLSSGALDAFCPKCEQNSVFHIDGIKYNFDEKAKEIPKNGVINITANCARDGDMFLLEKCEGRLEFCFYRNGDDLIKIGQYPSKASLDFNSLDTVFSKELDSSLREELGSAVGLRAHGVGVGSFVYLRRIFESLVDEAHAIAKKEKDWDEQLFKNARMPEKINLLSHQLPNRLVKTSKLYGILSKGIHELTEEECLSHFDLVVEAIKMILKERHEKKEYEKIVNNLGQAASDIEN